LLRDRRDRPIRVSSPVFEQTVIQLGHLTSPFGRPLTTDEVELGRSIYGESLALSRVRVVEAAVANAPTTLGNQIRISPGFSLADAEGRGVLIHELGHVWQYQTQGTGYITESLVCQIGAMIATGDRNAAYLNYHLTAQSSIDDFPAEEQAQIIQDYYEITVRYAGAAQQPQWVTHRSPDLPHYERLVEQVRRARPRSEPEIYQETLMVDPGERFGLVPNERSITPMQPLLRFEF
jgi:hypothetical protein